MVDAFSKSLQFLITSLPNIGILAMALIKGVLIERDKTCSMSFFYSSSSVGSVWLKTGMEMVVYKVKQKMNQHHFPVATM